MSHEMGMDEDHAFKLDIANEPDPNAEDKMHEQREQEKLDNKYENTASNLKLHECFNCGSSFSKFEALEDKVPEEYAETYCTPACMTSDLEQMAADKITNPLT